MEEEKTMEEQFQEVNYEFLLIQSRVFHSFFVPIYRHRKYIVDYISGKFQSHHKGIVGEVSMVGIWWTSILTWIYNTLSWMFTMHEIVRNMPLKPTNYVIVRVKDIFDKRHIMLSMGKKYCFIH